MEQRRISFDRVAHVYDETRGHPPEISSQVADSMVALLPPQATILEVGVGTGRIARPLLKRNLEVFGVDISIQMMTRFRQLVRPGSPMPYLFQADACQLPFRSNSFTTVLSVHVFHLIKEWQQALAEMLRVLRPDGYLCTGYDWRDTGSPHSQINQQWRVIVSKYVENPQHPGPRDFSEVVQVLTNGGAQMKEFEAAVWDYTFVPADYIQQIAEGTFSYSWKLDPELMPYCIAELKTWAIKEFGSLEVEFKLPKKFIWQIFRWEPGTFE